jgi:hypothetical protein
VQPLSRRPVIERAELVKKWVKGRRVSSIVWSPAA